jgi:hypothetical protein
VNNRELYVDSDREAKTPTTARRARAATVEVSFVGLHTQQENHSTPTPTAIYRARQGAPVVIWRATRH